MTPKLAIVASHPIQYHAPLYRKLAENGRIDIEVWFLDDHGLEPSYDPGLGRLVRFNVPLTEGYPHRYLPNVSPQPTIQTFFGTIHPAIMQALDPRRFDALYVNGYAHFSDWIAYATAAARGVPYLIRGETPGPSPEERASARWIAKRAVLGPLVHGAAGCLAIGLRNASFYFSLGARPDQVRFVPYSVDDEAFTTGGIEGRRQREARLTRLGLDPDVPVVLFAGKLMPRKRPFDAIKACDRLGGKVSILVIGDGEQYREVEAMAPTRPWMRALGFVNQQEIARWYGVADIFVLPSERETWGLVVNEAMAAGAVPVVSDAVGCGPDLVAGGTGRVYPVGDVDALAEAIATLVDPDARARALALAATILPRYSLDATVAGIEDAVRTL